MDENETTDLESGQTRRRFWPWILGIAAAILALLFLVFIGQVAMVVNLADDSVAATATATATATAPATATATPSGSPGADEQGAAEQSNEDSSEPAKDSSNSNGRSQKGLVEVLRSIQNDGARLMTGTIKWFLVWLLAISAAVAMGYLALQILMDGHDDETEGWTSRNLLVFWYLVWAAFTIFWIIAGPAAQDGFQIAEYLLLVVVPAFFPLSAIAYTLYQRERKLENLAQQFRLLGLMDKDDQVFSVRSDKDAIDRYRRSHSTSSFSLQTIMPVFLSVIGIWLMISGPIDDIAKVDLITNDLTVLKANLSQAVESVNTLDPESDGVTSQDSDGAAEQGSASELKDSIDALNTSLRRSQSTLEETQGRVEYLSGFIEDYRVTLLLDGTVIQGLIYGFLGAYIFSVQLIYRRYTTLDLKPSIYMQCAGTLLAGLAFNYVVFRSIADITGNSGGGSGLGAGVVAIVAFSLGYFPGFAIRWFNRLAYSAVGSSSRTSDALPLSLINGLSDFHEVRLRDEGIDNIQNLAVASIEDLIINTPFNVLQLVDWIDQSMLRLYVSADLVDAFRRAGVRGISDFREYWRYLQDSQQAQLPFAAMTGPDNGAQASVNEPLGPAGETVDEEVAGSLNSHQSNGATAIASFASRLQTTPEQLEILYFTTETAPNVALLDYPKTLGMVMRKNARKHMREVMLEEANQVVQEQTQSWVDQVIRSTADRGFFIRLLKYIRQLDSYESLEPNFIEVFGDPTEFEAFLNSDEERRKYALPLARWYRRLYDESGDDKTRAQAKEQARQYYQSVLDQDLTEFQDEASAFLNDQETADGDADTGPDPGDG